MKPTSFLLDSTLTPQCHWASQFGGCKTLTGETENTPRNMNQHKP